MPVGIEVSFSPTINVIKGKYTAFGVYVNNLKKPLLEAVEKVLAPSIKRNFDAKGRPSWESLSQATIEKKGHGDILFETGKLEEIATSLTIWNTKTSKGVGEAWIDGVPGAEYGEYHNSGFVNARTGTFVTARPWAVIQNNDERDVEAIFDEWLQDRIDKF